MAGLVLQPTMKDGTREEHEAFLEGVRARRLVAAIEYVNLKSLKLNTEVDVAQRKLAREIELLGNDLTRMEGLDNKINERLVKIETYRQEIGFIEDMQQKGLMSDGNETDD